MPSHTLYLGDRVLESQPLVYNNNNNNNNNNKSRAHQAPRMVCNGTKLYPQNRNLMAI